MIRQLLWRLLLIALPFVLYSLYLSLIRWRAGHTPPRTPWTVLFIIGLSLFSLSFLFWRFNDAPDATGTYVPPHLENGEVVPGRVEQNP